MNFWTVTVVCGQKTTTCSGLNLRLWMNGEREECILVQPLSLCIIIAWYSSLVTYLLTPWCRVLLEQLTGLQLVKKFPAFHGTRRFITVLTSVRHLSLSWASPIQSIYPHLTSWRSILILSTHLRLGLPQWSLSLRFPHQDPTYPSPHPYAPHAQPISLFSTLSPAQYWVRSTSHLDYSSCS